MGSLLNKSGGRRTVSLKIGVNVAVVVMGTLKRDNYLNVLYQLTQVASLRCKISN